MTRHIFSAPILLAGLALGATIAIPIAEAQRRPPPHGGGGGQQVRRTANSNVHRPPNRPNNMTRPANRPGGNVNRPPNRPNNRPGGNVNVNNVNVNRNVNVNGGGRYGYGPPPPPCCHGGGYYRDYDDYHPFATAAAVTAGVALTAAVIGSVTRDLPPSCSNVSVNGIGYYQCGSSWYQPQMVGTSVQYVVVASPR